jgi:predicted nucleotidyltransferase
VADDAVTGLIRQYLRNLGAAGIHATSSVLFGSFARGDAQRWSDIDLMIEVARREGRRIALP